MGSRQIVLVLTAGFSVIDTGIFWPEAKTKRLFSQCAYLELLSRYLHLVPVYFFLMLILFGISNCKWVPSITQLVPCTSLSCLIPCLGQHIKNLCCFLEPKFHPWEETQTILPPGKAIIFFL
jgi:hypothetical protein